MITQAEVILTVREVNIRAAAAVVVDFNTYLFNTCYVSKSREEYPRDDVEEDEEGRKEGIA